MTNLQENLTALSADLAIFERKIQHLAKEMTIDLSHYEIDHLALRVNSEQSAKNWLILLLKCGRILSDNIVNGRKIYLIELENQLNLPINLWILLNFHFLKIKNIQLRDGNILRL